MEMEETTKRKLSLNRCIAGVVITALISFATLELAQILTRGYWIGRNKELCSEALMIAPEERLEHIQQLCL